jgi:hypothetical protein
MITVSGSSQNNSYIKWNRPNVCIQTSFGAFFRCGAHVRNYRPDKLVQMVTFWLSFGRWSARIPADIIAALTGNFRGFPQLLRENFSIVPRNRPWPLPFESFTVHAIQFDAISSELLPLPLNKANDNNGMRNLVSVLAGDVLRLFQAQGEAHDRPTWDLSSRNFTTLIHVCVLNRETCTNSLAINESNTVFC